MAMQSSQNIGNSRRNTDKVENIHYSTDKIISSSKTSASFIYSGELRG